MLGLFTEYAAANHDQYGLGADPTTVRRAFDDLVRRAETRPVPSGDLLFTAADIRTVTFRLLYAENRFATWPRS